MEQKHTEKAFEIDLNRVFGALKQKLWLIILAALLAASGAFGCAKYLVTPMYQAKAVFYVNNSTLSLNESLLSITSADITASRGLVESYIAILNTRESMNKILEEAGSLRTPEELEEMMEASAVNATELFQVIVESSDPMEAETLADAVAAVLPRRIASIVEGSSAKVVDAAILPSKPSSPDIPKWSLIGGAAGFGLAFLMVALRAVFDVSIHTEEDIAQLCSFPVLASVPDMDTDGEKWEKVGRDIPFGAGEAYKLLRTKLQFYFGDEEDQSCRVIGLSSAKAGEGKSLTAVNLAHSLSQLGMRVLLMDCDLRRPTVAEKLGCTLSPGLSEFLAGQSQTENLIRQYGEGREGAFHVITSGRIPPNPMELLSSLRVGRLLKRLRESYDYILLDLPPVGEVGDALAASRLADGILMVVRKDHCDRATLTEALRQFAFLNVRILGIVFNGTEKGSTYHN